MRQEAASYLQQAVCVRRKKKIEEEKHEKSRPTQNTPRNPQQPGDRDHLETAREKPRPTLWPVHARFHRYRVCGNRHRTAVAISINDEFNVTHTHTNIPTDKLNNGTLYAPRYEEAFLPKGKKRPRSLRSFAPSALPHYEESFLP